MSNAASVVCDLQLAFVIDDDAKIQESIGAVLFPLGMKVRGYATAKPALAGMDVVEPAIIFLDVALLNSDAIDVIRGLGARYYGGVVQLMSGGRPSLLDAIGRIGARHGIRLARPLGKPFASEQIVAVIETLRLPGAFPLDRREVAGPVTSRQ